MAGIVVEVVVGIESVVAIELPGFAVELLRAALDGHGDGAAGGDAVIRRIVAGQHLELAQRILRRHHRHLAAGTAVICLAAVDDPDVVRLVEAVEADGEAGAHRGRRVLIGQVSADAQTQRGQCHHVAAVGGQFGDLLFVDQGADDVRVALHCQRIGFDT